MLMLPKLKSETNIINFFGRLNNWKYLLIFSHLFHMSGARNILSLGIFHVLRNHKEEGKGVRKPQILIT